MKTKRSIIINITIGSLSFLLGLLISQIYPRELTHAAFDFSQNSVMLSRESPNTLAMTTNKDLQIKIRVSSNAVGFTFYRDGARLGGMSYIDELGVLYGFNRLIRTDTGDEFLVYDDKGEIAERVKLLPNP